MGPPIEGAKNAIDALHNDGHTIIIHSVWANEKGIPAIADWLNYYEVHFDEITNLKPKADIYLDDKAVRFSNWETFVSELYSA